MQSPHALHGGFPDLKVVVHDDACLLRLMAESQTARTAVARPLASMSYIVDENHASGHVGKGCSQACLPTLPPDTGLFRGIPTNMCEIRNSDLSPLSHTVHHMGRWMFQICVQEYIDTQYEDVAGGATRDL